jgi:hypothetical protein
MTINASSLSVHSFTGFPLFLKNAKDLVLQLIGKTHILLLRSWRGRRGSRSSGGSSLILSSGGSSVFIRRSCGRGRGFGDVDNVGGAAAAGVEVAVDGGTGRLGRDVVFICAQGGLGGVFVGYVCCACFRCAWAVVSVGTYIVVFSHTTYVEGN